MYLYVSASCSLSLPLSILLSFFPNPPLSPSHAHTFNTCSRLVLAGGAAGAVCSVSHRELAGSAKYAAVGCPHVDTLARSTLLIITRIILY